MSDSKPTSFADDPVFDPNSTPSVKYPKPIITPEPTVKTTIQTQDLSEPSKKSCPQKCQTPCSVKAPNERPPWPTIIISAIGAGLLMYTAVGQNIPQDRRIFGIVMIILWTLLWALILWVLWREYHIAAAWWLLVIGVAIIVIFFVIVIALNLGGP
jgi:hypothetical protein